MYTFIFMASSLTRPKILFLLAPGLNSKDISVATSFSEASKFRTLLIFSYTYSAAHSIESSLCNFNNALQALRGVILKLCLMPNTGARTSFMWVTHISDCQNQKKDSQKQCFGEHWVSVPEIPWHCISLFYFGGNSILSGFQISSLRAPPAFPH